MAKYLLDTNVIVDLLRGKSALSPAVLEKGSAISTITLSELYYGAHKSNNITRHLDQVESLVDDFDLSLISFDKSAGQIYGKIKSQLETKGQRLEDIDLLIASTAISEDFVLVTNNLKHFWRIKGLTSIQP